MNVKKVGDKLALARQALDVSDPIATSIKDLVKDTKWQGDIETKPKIEAMVCALEKRMHRPLIVAGDRQDMKQRSDEAPALDAAEAIKYLKKAIAAC